ncbi:MAG: H-NS histone family protein [Rubrivivax sp.]
MAKTYDQIQRQIAQLQSEAEKLRRQEMGEVIARIRTAIEHYGITAADLGLDGKAKAKRLVPAKRRPGRKAAPKSAAAAVMYRDDAGNTWVGRGKRPQWLRDALAAGRTLADFKVAAPT